jgi:TolB-like protein/tetratricopeptide (TPR) repeat protein
MITVPSWYQRLFADLKRRNVFRVAAVYGATGFVVLQVAELLAEGMGLPPAVLRITTFLILMGFPIAMVLAWALEMTPAGVKRTDPAAAGELEAIIGLPAARRWPSGILALAGLTALMAGSWWVGKKSATGAGAGRPIADAGPAGNAAVLRTAYADLSDDTRPAIAVLPFADMSEAGDQEYFTDGITEELLNALARIRALRVAGRTSSFAYKGQDRDLRIIGAELGVRYLVEGSVRKQGDQLRITAQLVDAADNFHVWSDTYDRKLDDVFRIQTEIAEAVAAQLQVSLGLVAGGTLVTPTANLDAYELYLNGRARMRERGDGVQEAVRLFGEVTRMDPDWAPAWAGLAQAHALVPYYLRPGSAPLDSAGWAASLDAGEAAANRALALEPRNASAEVALGNANRDRWSWSGAEMHYLRALAIDPDDAEAHQQYAESLAAVGRLDEALRSAHRAVDLDATSTIRLNVLGYILVLNDRAAEGAEVMERAVAQRPAFGYPYLHLARAYLRIGNPDAAFSSLRAMPSEAGDVQLDALQRGWRARNGDGLASCCQDVMKPFLYMILGDTAQAIADLRHKLLEVPPFRGDQVSYLWHSELDGIRSDPRLRAVLARVGLEGVVPRRAPAEQ